MGRSATKYLVDILLFVITIWGFPPVSHQIIIFLDEQTTNNKNMWYFYSSN